MVGRDAQAAAGLLLRRGDEAARRRARLRIPKVTAVDKKILRRALRAGACAASYFARKQSTVANNGSGERRNDRRSRCRRRLHEARLGTSWLHAKPSVSWRFEGRWVRACRSQTVHRFGRGQVARSAKRSASRSCTGPSTCMDFKKDLDVSRGIVNRDYSDRFREPPTRNRWPKNRGPCRRHGAAVGSVIKLLTPASRNTSTEYNAWLRGIPHSSIPARIVFVKRLLRIGVG